LLDECCPSSSAYPSGAAAEDALHSEDGLERRAFLARFAATRSARILLFGQKPPVAERSLEIIAKDDP